MAFLAGLTAVVGCEDGAFGGFAVGDAEGAGSFEIDVEIRSDSLVYTWEGERARLLEVEDEEVGEIVWRITARELESGFASPVVHGSVPAEAREEVAAGIVTREVRHAVTVELVDGSASTESFMP